MKSTSLYNPAKDGWASATDNDYFSKDSAMTLTFNTAIPAGSVVTAELTESSGSTTYVTTSSISGSTVTIGLKTSGTPPFGSAMKGSTVTIGLKTSGTPPFGSAMKAGTAYRLSVTITKSGKQIFATNTLQDSLNTIYDVGSYGLEFRTVNP